MKIFIVKGYGRIKAFSTFEKAIEYVSPINYKAGMCIRFRDEDKEMYDQFMEECLGNMWVDRSVYEQWREDKCSEYGITEEDLNVYTEILFIEGVELE